MKKLTKVMGVILCLSLVLGMVGCSSKSESETAAVDKTETTEATVTEEAKEEAATQEKAEVNVAYMAKNTVDAFHATLNGKAKEILDGYVADGTIAKWQLYDAQTDANLQVSLLEDAINNGANFVILLPCEATGSDPVVKRCADLKIPCIVVNAYTDSTMELATAYSGSDDVEAGEIMANYIKEQVPDGGKYAHMMGVVGNSAQVNRGQGIKNILEGDSTWECVGEYAAEWSADKAVGFATDVITQYGDDLKAIICDNDDMSSAVQTYCNSIDRSDIVCIGIDGNTAALQMVQNGQLGATVLQEGAQQMKSALELIPGIIAGDSIETPITVPFSLVTKDNISNYIK